MSDEHLDEISESTMIVDTNLLKQVREGQQQVQAYLIVLSGSEVGRMHKLESSTISLGRSPGNAMRINDVGISRKHARLVLEQHGIFIEDMQSANGTFLNGERLTRRLQLRDGDKITLGSTTILKFTYHDKLDETFQKQMFDAALRDSLTGAYNKKYLINHLKTEFAFAARHASSLSLIMFDVDHFKRVNDTYMHTTGDAVLVKLAQIATESVRAEDVFARYGGEEFSVVCRGISMGQAAHLGERLRAAVEKEIFEHNQHRLKITVSVGVAGYPEIPISRYGELIEAADTALYAAKHGGRNRVMLATAR